MKRRIFVILAGLLLLSCKQEEHVAPTAERQGLTSLTAYVTFGPYMDQAIARLDIGDETATRLVIPVPFYFPEDSDDESTPYMSKMRVSAILDNNCSIDPPLGLIDLTKENPFVYTNARGEKRDIVITGERVRSGACQILSFNIIDPPTAGIVNQSARTVSLVAAEMLDASAEVELSPHATISPDPAAARDYDEPVVFTVTADDGVTQAVYTVSLSEPERIPAGINGELEFLYSFDPVSRFGAPAYSQPVYLSLGAIGRYLVVSYGDGRPIYLNKLNATLAGDVNVGEADVASIASDEGNHLLLCSHAEAGGECKIWSTASVTEAPVLFCTLTNPLSVPVGYEMKVIGDISGDAQIVLTGEAAGDEGAARSSVFVSIRVEDGAVTGTQAVDISASGYSWGTSPVRKTSLVPVSLNPDDGWFGCEYLSGDNDPYGNRLYWVKKDASIQTSILVTASGNINPNCLDVKRFNNCTYLALFVVDHFPAWDTPRLYAFDVTDRSRLSGDFSASGDASGIAANILSAPSVDKFSSANGGCAAGDVIWAPSADGYYLYLFYYDHNSGVIGAYAANCIQP